MTDTKPTIQPAVREVDTVASMESILKCVAQPVWVVDHDGNVVFVNPAGLAGLGYDDLSELRGRFGHDAIHYKHRDGSPYPAEECPMTRVRGTGEMVRMEEDRFVRSSWPSARRHRIRIGPASCASRPVQALTNVVKHAGAREATVSIAAENGGLTVEVSDDGVGGAQAGDGSGLRGLGDRVDALDATPELQSRPGRGTLLRARIPLRN